MILNKLTLHNFGVYAGQQIFDLSPDEDGRSVIIVGALNGCGKTTFLTAVQMVLYGPLSPSAKSKKMPYQDFLRGKINRSTNNKDGASIQLDFSVFDDEGERQYSVQRLWKETKSDKIREELTVFVDGKLNKFLTENWAGHVETLLPSRIMPLFFFDGEKIEELANEENASKILSSAVNGLLGLDLVHQLVIDLGVFELKKAKLLASKEEIAEFDAAQDALKTLENERSDFRQKRGTYEAKLGQQQEIHRKAVTKYATEGGELYEKREALKLGRENSILNFSNHAEEIAKVAEAGAPLLLVRDLLDEVTIQSDLEEVSEKAQTVLELFSVHDRKTVGKLTDLGAGSEYVEKLTNYLTSERKSYEDAASHERYLKFSKTGREQLHALNKLELDASIQNVANGLEKNAELADAVDQLEKLLLGVPEEEAIKPFAQAVESCERKITEFEEKIRSVDSKIHELDIKITSAGRELRLRMSSNVDAQLEAEDTARFLKHSEKVKSTLATFKKIVLRKKLQKLENLILGCFEELTRKSKLINRLSIDPETFEMSLMDKHGDVIETSDLSSGERQLLATSILWGLSKASQRLLPTIIDTPLGRLDSSHRGTLCGKYFPKASHQVILLSTDEEVDERYLEILQPSINKTYRVEFDAELGGSTVCEGYLF
jgi:DNA sulfur modification protein DndD